jgi:hypothetical protein
VDNSKDELPTVPPATTTATCPSSLGKEDGLDVQ